MRPILKVENIGKRYHLGTRSTSLRETLAGALRRRRDPELWALRGVSFEVRPGEVVGLVGPNGAGKSTLLKILSRVTEPTEGRAELYGRVGSLLEVGTGFHPELTGRDNVYLSGSILGMRQAEIARRFDEIVEFSGVKKFLDTPVKRYSSGMYVRLAFAVAAHLESEILLVDEVLAVGDATFQKKCLSKMGEVAQGGRTVIFVSHNLPSVTQLCTRALLVEQGQIKLDDTARAVVEGYMGKAAGKPEAAWPGGTGNDLVKLLSVRVLDAAGNVRASFGMDDDVTIEMSYVVLRTEEICAGLHLYNGQGQMLFIAADFHDREWFDVEKGPGRYVTRCVIPGNLLNLGPHFVDVALSKAAPQQAEVFERGAVSFELIDDGTSMLRGKFSAPWEMGLLRPKLPWKTERAPE